MRSLGCHERVGFRGSRFRGRLTIERIIAYCALSGFDIFRPLDHFQIEDVHLRPCKTFRNSRIEKQRLWVSWARLTQFEKFDRLVDRMSLEAFPSSGLGSWTLERLFPRTLTRNPGTRYSDHAYAAGRALLGSSSVGLLYYLFKGGK
ncbi:unnamed protein product [Prunus armeniaca]